MLARSKSIDIRLSPGTISRRCRTSFPAMTWHSAKGRRCLPRTEYPKSRDDAHRAGACRGRIGPLRLDQVLRRPTRLSTTSLAKSGEDRKRWLRSGQCRLNSSDIRASTPARSGSRSLRRASTHQMKESSRRSRAEMSRSVNVQPGQESFGSKGRNWPLRPSRHNQIPRHAVTSNPARVARRTASPEASSIVCSGWLQLSGAVMSRLGLSTTSYPPGLISRAASR